MSCMWCKHFHREVTYKQRKLDGLEYLSLPGMCTLQPTHVEVSGNHYCASFFLGANSGYGNGGSIIANWWLADRKERSQIPELRAKIKRLKEANRKLRDKLKSPSDTE